MLSLFLFLYSFTLGYEYIYAAKAFYSVFNGPQGAITISLVIKYFECIDKRLILLGTGSINIIKYIFNALSGSFVGFLMKEDTQWNSLVVELTFETLTAVSFFSAVAVGALLAKKNIILE